MRTDVSDSDFSVKICVNAFKNLHIIRLMCTKAIPGVYNYTHFIIAVITMACLGFCRFLAVNDIFEMNHSLSLSIHLPFSCVVTFVAYGFSLSVVV